MFYALYLASELERNNKTSIYISMNEPKANKIHEIRSWNAMYLYVIMK